MIETAGYEAAAVRNHSPEKETNILVIIIIASSKRYYMSRKKISFVYFFSVSNFKFPKKKENRVTHQSFHSIIHLSPNSKRIQNLHRDFSSKQFSRNSLKRR